MRVVVAPDKFAGTLTAVAAAEAIAAGWQRTAPGDELVTVPMSDGGPGFLDVLHASSAGELTAVTVTGPYGDPVPAAVLVIGETAYVESAQAVGLALTPENRRDPERATSFGVGELVLHALGRGAQKVVVGLGGSATNDGGAGMLAALGATATGGQLGGGPSGLLGVTAVDLEPARRRLDGVELLAASDVESPLLGITGATKTFGPQKGILEERLVVVDGWLQHFADLTDRKLAAAKGSGAAGGLGFGLALLGGVRRPGIQLVGEATGLAQRLAGADLAVTGEGQFDFSSRSGKVPYGVAEAAARHLVPCIALAGRVRIGGREMRAMGIEAAYSIVDLLGEERSLNEPFQALSELATRVARTWSPPPRRPGPGGSEE